MNEGNTLKLMNPQKLKRPSELPSWVVMTNPHERGRNPSVHSTKLHSVLTKSIPKSMNNCKG